MAISLYDASVATYLQTLGAVGGFLDLGLAHCRENNIDPEEIVETRLFPDMRPFRFQVQSVAYHSAGGVQALKNGGFQPEGERPPYDYAGLQGLIAEAQAALQKVTPEEINAREGAEVVFEARGNKRFFTTEQFLLSFSLPNFHFHATTAYDILRSKGVPVGKRHYMGELRLKA